MSVWSLDIFPSEHRGSKGAGDQELHGTHLPTAVSSADKQSWALFDVLDCCWIMSFGNGVVWLEVAEPQPFHGLAARHFALPHGPHGEPPAGRPLAQVDGYFEPRYAWSESPPQL
jgi:hypothetical protein